MGFLWRDMGLPGFRLLNDNNMSNCNDIRSIQLPVIDTMDPMENAGYLHIRMSLYRIWMCDIQPYGHITKLAT